MTHRNRVTVGSLVGGLPEGLGLPLELLAGAAGVDRVINSPHVQKTGLALAGFHEYLKPGRVLIFGESEIRFLESLDATVRASNLHAAMALDFPCVLITGGFEAPPELVFEAEWAHLPLLRTPVATPSAIAKLSAFLDEALAERTIVHGVLIDVLGLGVLITGESGIGKSESALDLIVRGHHLVADDAVEVRRRADAVLVGSCPALTQHHMELRGLGIINIRALFGIASTRSSKKVELVVQLERWEPGRDYDRLGLDEQTFEILGVPVPLIRMPVAPGRNIAILVEVAARNQLLLIHGHHAARDLADRLDDQLRREAVAAAPDSGEDDGQGGRR